MRYILTLVSNKITAPLTDQQINGSIRILEKQGAFIENIHWLATDEACDIMLEYTHPSPLILDALSGKYQLDYRLEHADNLYRRKQMLISDMDSTIINQECIDELADVLGIKDKIAAITQQAMDGKLDFAESLRHRVSLLKDLPVSALEDVFDNRITLTKGAKELVQTMRRHGAYCVLVSGGFTFFTQKIADMVGFHAQYANILHIKDKVLSGSVAEPILDKESKLKTLVDVATEHHLPYEAVLAVGDGANDLPMLKKAGLGIAYYAHEHVRTQVPVHINHTSLRALLFFQGYSEEEIVSGDE